MEEQILNILKNLQSDMQEMKSDMQMLKTDMQEMKSEIATMKSDISDLKEQTKKNTDLIKALISRTDIISAELEGFKVNTAKEFGEIRAELKTINDRLDEHEFGYREHDYAIMRIKRKIGA